MFTVSRALPVNPPGEEPRLTRAEVWRGLEMKANNALPFVPSISYCVVTERISDTQFVREIEFRGERAHERVTLEPERRVTFERLDGSVSGHILNEVEESDDGDLQLRFTYSLEIAGVAAGSDEERDYAAGMEADYLKAVAATLGAVRKVAAQGPSAPDASAPEWVTRYYDDVDHMRMDEFIAWHAPDVTVQFANNPQARGHDQVRGAIGHFWEMIGGLKHNFVNVWEEPDGTAVVEAEIDYTRLDGDVVTTPCVTLLHRGDAGIDSVKIFIDVAPVFGPAASGAVEQAPTDKVAAL